MSDRKIGLFQRLEIETHSECNRKCVTCIRNSDPDKDAVAHWFEPNSLSTDDFRRVLEQAQAMGFNGEVCLSHYNEPLMDDRIVELARMTKDMGFHYVFFGSNADFLTPELAAGLDGVMDYIGFSLYMDEPKRSERAAWVKTLFRKTTIQVGYGEHMATHFSPLFDVASLVRSHKDRPCFHPKKRMIVNHRGEMLLCCDDLTGHFDLGTIHNHTVEELWWSEKHQQHVLELQKSGGRGINPHCLSCPRE